MDDERRRIERAARAGAILEDELFRAAVEAVRGKLIGEFERSALDDDDARRAQRLCLDLLQRLVGELARHMTDGRLAAAELARPGRGKAWTARLRERL